MPQDDFERECDRLSQIVDGPQYERLRWDRNEGPMLARLVALALAALETRSEFELAEEGSTSAIKRFVLKIHSIRTVAISIQLKEGVAHVGAERIERSAYLLAGGGPHTADFAAVDDLWMANALKDLFSRVHAQPQAEAL